MRFTPPNPQATPSQPPGNPQATPSEQRTNDHETIQLDRQLDEAISGIKKQYMENNSPDNHQDLNKTIYCSECFVYVHHLEYALTQFPYCCLLVLKSYVIQKFL